MITDEDIVAFRKWAEHKGDAERAAVGLLIEHDHWLWNEEFEALYVRRGYGEVFLDFTAMRAFNPRVMACSDGQAAILRAAADIGSDRWGIGTLDGRNRYRLARAVEIAVGMHRG